MVLTGMAMESKNIEPSAKRTIVLNRLAANLCTIYLNLNSALLRGKYAESLDVFMTCEAES